MNLDFYKNKFEREQKRRVDLDSAMNLPILVLTLIMGLNSYVLKAYKFNSTWSILDYSIVVFLILSVILILISSYFIFLASNNLLKGFDYPHFDLMLKYREIELFNKDCDDENEKIDLEELVKDKLVIYADESTLINEKRGENLFQSRKFIIINFIITIINIIITTSINLLK
ncbi:hypothetical protein ABEG63_16795 [Chryseobacterium sp. C39-AII1]|uniref:hypothetical protein n=1 Tax=Chryseobacterium sp. C39-AII1 TaxID=3080332 RepID=UPI0032090AB0